MADLLSPEWFEQLRDKLASIAPLGDATHELALGQVVEDAPEGAVGWTIHLGGGKAARFELGVDQAEVTIIENLDTMPRPRSCCMRVGSRSPATCPRCCILRSSSRS